MSQKGPLLSGGGEGPLLLGITRKVRKLALLSGSRNVRGGRGGALLSELYGNLEQTLMNRGQLLVTSCYRQLANDLMDSSKLTTTV